MVKICLAVAVADNGVIGQDNGLPWHLTTDLKFFKSQTMGKPLIMGRKTHESIGRILPGRPNIVVTRDQTYEGFEGAQVCHSLDTALARARDLAEAAKVEEIMVIGGAQIYQETLATADRLYLTEVHLSPAGDAFFPQWDSDTWRAAWREVWRRNETDPSGTQLSFVRLDRR